MSILLLGFGCKNKDKKENVQPQYTEENGQSLKVDTDASTIYWTGTGRGTEHHGTLKLKEGIMYISDDNNVKMGGFTIDMNTINSTSISNAKDKNKLEAHLGRIDFFNIVRFPDAKFTINYVKEVPDNDSITHHIGGVLSLKNFEQPVEFYAKITKDGDKYIAQTLPFKIDRTKWGIVYGSNTVYDAMQNSIVDDDIGLKITIVAYPQKKEE